GLQIACQMTFISIGNARASILVAIVRKFLLLIPLIYILPRILPNQVMAVYLAEPVSDFIAVVFTGVLFFFQFRRAMREIEG
ncbi:MAG: MATE family efflux transporter, partial [Eubacteriales bacterium]|nr:MATE family efflux transporter [Eubacteriales bacterium]